MTDMRTNCHQEEDGFVLVEILSALIIVAIASIAFLKISAAMSERTHQAKSQQTLYVTAQRLLTDERQKLRADFSERDGVLNDGATGWSVSTKPLAGFDKPNNEQPVIAEIVVTVWDPRKASLDKYELRHFQTYGNGS